MDQAIEPLTDAERDWIAGQLEAARLFAETWSPEDTGQPVALAALDRAFAAWLDTGETAPDAINSVINCVGTAFGQHLVDKLPLDWVIASDAEGSELAVYGLPGAGDVLIYPANFVAKRWERRKTHFLEVSFQGMVEQVSDIPKTAAESTKPKPWWKRWSRG